MVNVPRLRPLFDSIAGPGGDIDRAGIVSYLTRIGVTGFGGMVVSGAADEIFAKLDPQRTGRISWEQFRDGSARLLPPELLDPQGRIRRDQVDPFFAAVVDPASNRATVASVYGYLFAQMSRLPDAGFTTRYKADVAARVVVDAIDRDGDKAFTKAELDDALNEIDEHLGIH